jgi:hypothetical protein
MMLVDHITKALVQTCVLAARNISGLYDIYVWTG